MYAIFIDEFRNMKALSLLIIFLLAGTQPALLGMQTCASGTISISKDASCRCCCSGMQCCCKKNVHNDQETASHAKNANGKCSNPFCSAASGMPGQEPSGLVQGSTSSLQFFAPVVPTYAPWVIGMADINVGHPTISLSPLSTLSKIYPPLRI